ncbi:MAG TPA: autotransporter domain-containing protein [Xanthobacteraceae bacterium]|nr:autotransporter domain-containing protein [Xanthobacteraceae bacterium]
MQIRIGRRRGGLLLASSSIAALLVGGGAPALAGTCGINDVGISTGPVPNSGAINCINIQSSTVTGDVTNTATGTINAGAAFPTNIGITINNSTINGAIINAGSIAAPGSAGVAGVGIEVTNALVTGGITNSSALSAKSAGIVVGNLTTFGGGLTNNGTIQSGEGIGIEFVSTFAGDVSNNGTIAVHGTGLLIGAVSTFTGSVANTGTISAGAGIGIVVEGLSAFTGNISNASTGTIAAHGTGIFVGTVTSFGGGVTNAGSITSHSGDGIFVVGVSTFGGNISNAGTISAPGTGGQATGISVIGITTFLNGITNTGSITANANGISVRTMSFFAGNVSNNGTISAHSTGFILGNISTFGGSVTNAGTISSSARVGMFIGAMSTFAGSISNGGTITAHSQGVEVVLISTFAGGITNTGSVSSATSLGIGVGSISTFGGNVSSNGTITGQNGIIVDNVAAFGGGVINTGKIIATSAGGIVIVGISTFAGSIINGGTISAVGTGIGVGSVATFGGGISNTGTISAAAGIVLVSQPSVSVFDSGTIIGTGGTAIAFASGTNTLTLGPGFNIQGNVVGAGADTFQLGGNGSGNFNLSTIGPQYQGFTTFNVVSGVWNTTGTFSQAQAWNVNGGTLAGTGTFASVNVNAGGTLAPGTPGTPGTVMTIDSNLTFAPGAAYLVNLNPTTASRATVVGTATLNGVVQGFLAPGLYNGKTTYDVLDLGSRSGQFTGFTALNAPGFGGTLTYTSTDVLLNLTANLGGGGGLNQNQQNVASAIDNFFNSGGTLPANFLPLFALSGSGLPQFDGEVATGAEHAAFQLTNEFLDLMLDPFANGRGNSSGVGPGLGFAPDEQTSLPPDVARAYAAILTKAPPPSFAQRWSAWGSAYGGANTANGNAVAGSSNITASTYGFAGGMDYRVTADTSVGFALAGAGTSWSLANALGTGRSDALQVGAYGISRFGPAYVAGALSFSNHWFTTSRFALGDQLKADFVGQGYGARVEGGYRVAVLPTLGVTPYGAVQLQDFKTPAYGETDQTGGGFGLNVAAMNATDVRTELGSRFDAPTLLGSMPLVLSGRLAWAHDFVSNPALSAAFQALPGASFTVNGAPVPRDSALTTAAAQLFLTPQWTLGAKFEGELAAGAQTYAGIGTLRYRW